MLDVVTALGGRRRRREHRHDARRRRRAVRRCRRRARQRRHRRARRSRRCSHVVAGLDVPYVVMHWRGPSAVMDELARYDDVVAEVVGELAARVDAAVAAGVAVERIIVDPGIGFAKTAAHNWALLQPARCARGAGPTGARRRVRGSASSSALAGPEARDDATVAVSALAAAAGVWGVRVHEPAANLAAVAVGRAWRDGDGRSLTAVREVASLDRAAAERVLRRASELAGAEPDEALPLGAIDEDVLDRRRRRGRHPGERGAPGDRHRAARSRRRPTHVGDPLVGPTIVIDEQELPGRADEVLGPHRSLARRRAPHAARPAARRPRRVEQAVRGRQRNDCAPCATPPARVISATSSASPPRRATPASGRASCASRPTAVATARCASPSGVAVGGVATAGVVGVALVTVPLVLLAAPVAIAAGCGLAATGRRRADAGRSRARPGHRRRRPAGPAGPAAASTSSAASGGCRAGREPAQHLGVQQPVGADRRVVAVRRHALAVGERPAGLLDEQAHGGDVVGGDPDGVDGDVEGTLGDEGVLPEVAEAADSPRVARRGRRAPASGRGVPAVVERDADLGVGDGWRPSTRGTAARRRTSRRPPSPTSAGRAPAPTRRRRRRRRRGRGRSASPTPGCRGRSPTCRRSGRRSTPTATTRHPTVRAPRRAGGGAAGRRPGARRSPPRRPGRAR